MNWYRTKVYEKRLSRGLFTASDSVAMAEIQARAGFDWLILDMEHGMSDENLIWKQIAMMQRFETAPLVRVPSLRTDIIKRVLDFGAAGIMAPMIESEEEARELIAAMRYPPDGFRSLSSGSMAAGFGWEFKEYIGRANTELLAIVQIESKAGLSAVDKVAAVDGVDVLFLGHSDLSLNLGHLNDFEHPEMLEAEGIMLDACRKHGKVAGMMLKHSMNIDEYFRKGFNFIAQGTDLSLLRGALKNLTDQVSNKLIVS